MGKLVTKEPYSVNGKFHGAFYTLTDGRQIYLSHQTPSKRLKEKSAWAINEYVLRRCEERGIQTVGVVIRDGSRRLYYVTPMTDFYGPHSFLHFGKTGVQRALPSKLFRIDPSCCSMTLEKRAAISR